MFSSNSGSPKSYAHQPGITYGFNRAWDQPEWHIDPINGNDLNVGDTAFNPIKTANQYHHRVGTVHEFNKNINMRIYSSLIAGDTLNLQGLRYTSPSLINTYFHVIGIPKLVASGIATVRVCDPINNIPWGISCPTIGSFAPHIQPGRMISKVSGSNANSTAFWLAKDENGIIARATQPFCPTVNMGTIISGDEFQIVDLPQVSDAIFSSELPYTVNGLIIDNIYFSGNTSIQGFTTFNNCAFAGLDSTSGRQWINNCQILNYISAWKAANPYIQFGLALNALFLDNGRINIEYRTLLQGCTTHANLAGEEGFGGGVTCHGSTFAIFDSPGSGIIVGGNQVWDIRSYIWGSGNAGHPVEIENGGRLIYRQVNPFTLTGGAVSDILLGGRDNGPAVDPTTWAYTANRAYSFPNLGQTVALGGFGNNIFAPDNPYTAMGLGY